MARIEFSNSNRSDEVEFSRLPEVRNGTILLDKDGKPMVVAQDLTKPDCPTVVIHLMDQDGDALVFDDQEDYFPARYAPPGYTITITQEV